MLIKHEMITKKTKIRNTNPNGPVSKSPLPSFGSRRSNASRGIIINDIHLRIVNDPNIPPLKVWGGIYHISNKKVISTIDS